MSLMVLLPLTIVPYQTMHHEVAGQRLAAHCVPSEQLKAREDLRD